MDKLPKGKTTQWTNDPKDKLPNGQTTQWTNYPIVQGMGGCLNKYVK